MISERLKKVILNELQLDDFDFQIDTTADQVPGWDSLSHINVILAVENAFKVRFRPYELLKLKNIGELQSLLDSKLNNTSI